MRENEVKLNSALLFIQFFFFLALFSLTRQLLILTMG